VQGWKVGEQSFLKLLSGKDGALGERMDAEISCREHNASLHWEVRRKEQVDARRNARRLKVLKIEGRNAVCMVSRKESLELSKIHKALGQARHAQRGKGAR